MSIIDIKSTKQAQNKKPDFDFQSLNETGHEKTSRTPFIVGISLASLLVYLKSSSVSHASPAPRDEPAPEQDSELQSDNSESVIPFSGGNPSSNPGTSSPVRQRAILPDLSQADHLELPSLDLLQDWQTSKRFSLPFFPALQNTWALPNISLGQPTLVGSNDNDRQSGAASRRASAVGADLPPPRSNRPPDVKEPVTLREGFSGMAVMFGLSDLLRGSTDPDGDELQVVGAKASQGQLVQVDDGYIYIGNTTGEATFTYYVTDGSSFVQQTASVAVTTHASIDGTALSDTLSGTDADDFIKSFEGNDGILAGDGIDTVYAGEGDDTVRGGAGNDLLFGGGGNDTIYGEDGNDVILGGSGQDQLFGGRGNDLVYGEDGNDSIYGDDGDDKLFGGVGNDEIHDGLGQDRVEGNEGNDTVAASADGQSDYFVGGTGKDRISYAASNASVTFDISGETVSGTTIGEDHVIGFEIFEGGSGQNTFIAAGGELAAADQTFVGGTNLDTLDYGAATETIEINLVSGKATGKDIGVDTFSSIEHFNLGHGDDIVEGSNRNDEIRSADGDDLVYGEDGDDLIYGGRGADFLFGDRGDDELHDGEGADVLDAGEGDDTIFAASDKSDDFFDGGEGEDRLSYADSKFQIVFDIASESAVGRDIGNDQVLGFEIFRGGSGNDVFIAAGNEIATANQRFEGSSGRDTLDYGDSANAIELDIVTGVAAGVAIGVDAFENIERFVTGAGDDLIIVGKNGVSLVGGYGDDIFQMSDDVVFDGRPVRHMIEDFEVGDRVRLSLYDIFEQDQESDLEARMGSLDQMRDSEVPIRFRSIDGGQKTVIEADFDNDNKFEVTIELDGSHHLLLHLHQIA
jgi:Ca2+-binding RTX toxin-like protein